MSYTSFSMVLVTPSASSTIEIDTSDATATVNVTVEVANIGNAFPGTETVMAFFRPLNRTSAGGAGLLPLQRRLCGFVKVGPVPPQSSVVGYLELRVSEFAIAAEDGSMALVPGGYSLILSRGTVGQPEITLGLELTGGRQELWALPAGI